MESGNKSNSIGKYQIVSLISSGAMSSVHKVQRDSQFFALKLLKFSIAEDVHRFRKEAAALARLNHSGLVKIFDSSEHKGVLSIDIKLVERGTFRDYINRGPAPIEDFKKIACSLASALGEIHKFKMVHLDIKPAKHHYQ